MSISVLPPTNDWIFKLLFGDERNKSTLIDLLKSFVELPDEEYELTFLDPHVKREAEDDKLGILDVKVKTKTGKVIDIEIQVEPMKDIGKRLSFYKSKLIAEQIGKKEHYSKIQRVICVCITSKPLFLGVKGYLNNFRFYNRENGLCFEDMPEEIYTLELSKVPDAADGSAVWGWLQFLRAKTMEEFEMAAERNPEIRKALENLYELSQNAEVREEYERRLKAWRDYASQMDGHFWEGVEQTKRENARNALAEGLPMEVVQRITGLDIETISGLKEGV